MILLLGALALVASTQAFYSKTGDVIPLSDMKGPTGKDSGVWLVEFFSPGCGHCVQAKPEYEKAATALRGIAKVASLDMTVPSNQKFGSTYKVQGFPTFKIFSNGKVSDYSGQRTAYGFVEGVTGAISALAKANLGGGGGGSKQQQSKSKPESAKASSSNPVEKLTDDTFDLTVMDSTDMFLVAFVADYCGHCKSLKPAYLAAAKKLFGTGIRFATVEAPENAQLSQRFGVNGFPTIKVFGPGEKKADAAFTYEGGRDEESIVSFAQEKFESMGGSISVNVEEVVSSAVFDKICGKTKRCVLVVLDDLLDTSAKERSREIEVVQMAAKNARHMPFGWLAANSQASLERVFGLTFGFPAVLMLREGPGGEKVGFIHRGKFTWEAITGFVSAQRSLSTGTRVEEWPVWSKVAAWDGKEAKKVAVEKDDFNLDEFLSEL